MRGSIVMVKPSNVIDCESLTRTLQLNCSCYHKEHQLSLSYLLPSDQIPDDRLSELSVHVFLAERVWFKRVWLGIKYIFGFKCAYGHFQEILLKESDLPKIISFVLEYCMSSKKSS